MFAADVANPFLHQYWADRFGTEQDEPLVGCVPDSRLDELESMASHAERSYRAITTPDGRKFADPTPNQLGPVVQDEHGRAAVRLYLHPNATSVGATKKMGPGSRVHRPEFLAFVFYNIPFMRDGPEWNRYKTVAHEIGHVFQYAQKGFQNIPEVDASPPPWVSEATAEAMAVRFLQDWNAPGPMDLSVAGSRSLYGLRPYNRALTWNSGNSDTDGHGNKLVTRYTTQSFWTYLADRFHAGSFHYLIDWFGVPEKNRGSDDWLEWLDDHLVQSSDIAYPFYLAFPDFIANYAGWGRHKYPHLGSQTWLNESFDCVTITLAPGVTSHRVRAVQMEPVSARCYRVVVQGPAEGWRFAVDGIAYDDNRRTLDDFHLVASRLESSVNEDFDCYQSSRSGARELCVEKAFQDPPGRQLGPSDRGGVKKSGGGYAKTWVGIEQARATGGRNTYFLVHAPITPKDVQHSVVGPGPIQPVEVDSLDFVLRAAWAKVSYSGALEGEYEVPDDRVGFGPMTALAASPGGLSTSGCLVSVHLPSDGRDLVTIGGVIPGPPVPGRFPVRPLGDAVGEMDARVWPACERGLCSSPDPDEFNNDRISYGGTFTIAQIDRYSVAGSFQLSSVDGPAVGVSGSFITPLGGHQGFPVGHACTPVASPPITDGTLDPGSDQPGASGFPDPESSGPEDSQDPDDGPESAPAEARAAVLRGSELLLDFVENGRSVLWSEPQSAQGMGSATRVSLSSGAYDLTVALPAFGCTVDMGDVSAAEQYELAVAHQRWLQSGRTVQGLVLFDFTAAELRLDATGGTVTLDLESAEGGVTVRGTADGAVNLRAGGPATVVGDVSAATLAITRGDDTFGCEEPMDFSFTVAGTD